MFEFLTFAETFFLYLAWLTLGLFALNFIEIFFGNRTIKHIGDIRPFAGSESPRVSIVVAARNEEAKMEEALNSLLSQDYENLEIVFVDDRSTDSTGQILDRLAASNARLKAVHITELPSGWLGKNHALHVGASKASGDYVLFTDADVVIEKTTVARAVRFMAENGIDHLAVSPSVPVKGYMMNAFIAAFIYFFGMYCRPWRARNPKSRFYVGVGAFNMVKRKSYEAAGGHKMIAMRVDDDVMLGKVIKLHGFRQDILFGPGFVSVEWYRNVGEAVAGLKKNMFAGLQYNLFYATGSIMLLILLDVWPFIALAATTGTTRLLNVGTVIIIMMIIIGGGVKTGPKWWHALGFPLATLLFCYMVMLSTATTLVNGGIDWRGTFYPLKDLKASKI